MSSDGHFSSSLYLFYNYGIEKSTEMVLTASASGQERSHLFLGPPPRSLPHLTPPQPSMFVFVVVYVRLRVTTSRRRSYFQSHACS